MRVHKLEELVPDWDGGDVVAVQWVCECGTSGTSPDQPRALTDWDEHSKRRDYRWCRLS